MTRETRPLVSVVVPVYQVEDTLRECLDSIEAQTYDSLEIILIDDGSTDGSAAIYRDYAARDKRIRVVVQPNGGLSAARNTGLDHATGDYLLFVDSDDWISPNHISTLLSVLMEEECDVAVTNLTPFHKLPIAGDFKATRQKLTGEAATEVIFYQGMFDTCAPAKLYRADLWDGVRFPAGYIHEDLPTVYKVMLRANKVVFIPGTTYGYRFNSTGLNHSKTTPAKMRTLDLVQPISKEMKMSSPGLVPAAECFYLSFCFHLLLNASEESLPKSDRERLASEVRRYRKRVLFDAHARKKTRAACLLSYGGIGFVKRVFNALKGTR